MLLIDKIAYENRLLDLSPGIKGCLYLFLLISCFLSPPIVQVLISLIIG